MVRIYVISIVTTHAFLTKKCSVRTIMSYMVPSFFISALTRECPLRTALLSTSSAFHTGTSVLEYKSQRKATNQKATGSNPVGRAIENHWYASRCWWFSFLFVQGISLDFACFFRSVRPQRSLRMREVDAAFFRFRLL